MCFSYDFVWFSCDFIWFPFNFVWLSYFFWKGAFRRPPQDHLNHRGRAMRHGCERRNAAPCRHRRTIAHAPRAHGRAQGRFPSSLLQAVRRPNPLSVNPEKVITGFISHVCTQQAATAHARSCELIGPCGPLHAHHY